MGTKCPVCGAPLDGRECGYCGYSKGMAEQTKEYTHSMFERGRENPNQQFINGGPILNNIGIIHGVSRKSKIVTLLLCIFLGELGVHRFYVGKVGTGLLYLFTFGFLGIGWIIDIIRIATGTFRDGFDLLICQ